MDHNHFAILVLTKKTFSQDKSIRIEYHYEKMCIEYHYEKMRINMEKVKLKLSGGKCDLFFTSLKT